MSPSTCFSSLWLRGYRESIWMTVDFILINRFNPPPHGVVKNNRITYTVIRTTRCPYLRTYDEGDYVGRRVTEVRMDDIVWLREMFRQELDLRPPSLARINQKSIIMYDDDNNPIGHAIRTNRWKGFEINSFVVDPTHRGRGISHKLLKKCGNERLFAYTRDSRLQSVLEKAGFERSKTPGFLSSLNLLISRLGMFSWMIFSLDFRRILHQLKHIRDYRLYVRE